jgi:hypothetical protein
LHVIEEFVVAFRSTTCPLLLYPPVAKCLPSGETERKN